jgi:4-amino-4-deoxy-L-arabinose transferase-like glycosyltransferase
MIKAGLERAQRGLRAALRSPLAWVLAACFLLRVVGIGWGLPASDGWDNDGVAPRDFLAGLVLTLAPGHYYTYPPVHLALLAVATAPATLVALVHAPSLATADVVHEILAVPYMTAIAYGARLVTVLMSLGLGWAVAKIAEELRGERAGWCAAAFAGVNVPLTYYAHTTNLDVPYLFWGSLAVLALVRAVARREPRRLRRWAVLAALAVGTKDQAYALFLFAAPAGLALWMAVDRWARRNRRLVLRETAVASGMAVGLLALFDGVLVNPAGFRERLRFLVGPASQPFAEYTNDWAGRWEVLHDQAAAFRWFYPPAFAALVLLGIVLLARDERHDRPRLVAAALPLLVAVSFTLAFGCVARRSDPRFVLPQMVLFAVYGGVALDALVFRVRWSPARWLARLAVAAAFAVALFAAVDVDASLLLDPRYEAERWLRERARSGDTIETYGLNVYLPRFPPGVRVVRVGPEPLDRRSPLPGVEEVVDAYDHAPERGARYIVVSEAWVSRYLLDPRELPAHGHEVPQTLLATTGDASATDYFRALTGDGYGPYRFEHAAEWNSRIWPRFDIHASTARAIWIYEAR